MGRKTGRRVRVRAGKLAGRGRPGKVFEQHVCHENEAGVKVMRRPSVSERTKRWVSKKVSNLTARLAKIGVSVNKTRRELYESRTSKRKQRYVINDYNPTTTEPLPELKSRPEDSLRMCSISSEKVAVSHQPKLGGSQSVSCHRQQAHRPLQSNGCGSCGEKHGKTKGRTLTPGGAISDNLSLKSYNSSEEDFGGTHSLANITMTTDLANRRQSTFPPETREPVSHFPLGAVSSAISIPTPVSVCRTSISELNSQQVAAPPTARMTPQVAARPPGRYACSFSRYVPLVSKLVPIDKPISPTELELPMLYSPAAFKDNGGERNSPLHFQEVQLKYKPCHSAESHYGKKHHRDPVAFSNKSKKNGDEIDDIIKGFKPSCNSSEQFDEFTL